MWPVASIFYSFSLLYYVELLLLSLLHMCVCICVYTYIVYIYIYIYIVYIHIYIYTHSLIQAARLWFGNPADGIREVGGMDPWAKGLIDTLLHVMIVCVYIYIYM